MNEKWEQELLEENPPYELEKLDKESILEDKIFDYLIALPNSPNKTRIIEKLRGRAKEYIQTKKSRIHTRIEK